MKTSLQSARRPSKGVIKPRRKSRPSKPQLETEVVEIVPLSLTLKRILVPIDFSNTSRKALRYAVPIAKQFGAKLTLLHVIELPGYTGDPAYVGYDLPGTQRNLNRQLKDLAARILPPDIRASTLVEVGVGFDTITRVARDRSADLIVITTHGYTGLKHVLMGSTAERVVRHAKCPVLVVR
jgi:nucleotide-binding universal stress UspA family protein